MNERALQAKIDRLNGEIDKREIQRNKLMESLAESMSRNYIEEHGITLAQVHSSDDLDFFNAREFQIYLLAKDLRLPWAEWHGQIYHTEDLIHGRHKPTPARICDLEEMESTK